MYFYLFLFIYSLPCLNPIPPKICIVLQTISCAEKMGEEYTAEEVMVDVKVDASQVEGLRQQLQDATKGEGRLEERKGGDGTK